MCSPIIKKWRLINIAQLDNTSEFRTTFSKYIYPIKSTFQANFKNPTLHLAESKPNDLTR